MKTKSPPQGLTLVVVAAAATTVVAASYWYSKVCRGRRRHSCQQENDPATKQQQQKQQQQQQPSNIILYRFDPPAGQPYGNKSCSPFGIKVETFLRLYGLDYQCPPCSVRAIWRNPKTRKLPTCDINGVLVADSTFIIHYLIEQYNTSNRSSFLGQDQLTPHQKAVGVAVKALCEDCLYFIIGYWRYQYDPGFEDYLQCNPVLHRVPQPIRWILERLARKAICDQLWQQGIGRHSVEQVTVLGQDAVDAIDALLNNNDKPYLLGDKPSIYDATLFAMCSGIVEMNVRSPLQDYTLQKKNIMAYIERMNKQCGWTE